MVPIKEVTISLSEFVRLRALETQVIKMVTQRGDDFCWRDAYVYCAKLVGIEFNPELMEPIEMLENCCSFIRSLRSGQYIPVWTERNPNLQPKENPNG